MEEVGSGGTVSLLELRDWEILNEVETDLIWPPYTARHVRRVLWWINPEDVKDLHSIRVIDGRPNDPEYRERPHYLSGFLYNGHYECKTKDRNATVVLYAEDVYFGVPKIFAGSAIATLKLAHTLAHEIGHHVIATKGYLYRPWEKYREWNGRADPYEEMMAQSYASDVIDRMLSRWPYRWGQFWTRKLSSLFCGAGVQEYWDGNYQKSAQLTFRAYHLDPTNNEANTCYRHAMEKLKTQTPSPLNETEREWLLHGYDRTAKHLSRFSTTSSTQS